MPPPPPPPPRVPFASLPNGGERGDGSDNTTSCVAEEQPKEDAQLWTMEAACALVFAGLRRRVRWGETLRLQSGAIAAAPSLLGLESCLSFGATSDDWKQVHGSARGEGGSSAGGGLGGFARAPSPGSRAGCVRVLSLPLGFGCLVGWCANDEPW